MDDYENYEDYLLEKSKEDYLKSMDPNRLAKLEKKQQKGPFLQDLIPPMGLALNSDDIQKGKDHPDDKFFRLFFDQG